MKPDFIDYRVRKDAARYREALAEIGGRHGLDVRRPRADEYGVYTVFHLPAGEVVKLFTASGTAEHEAAVMQCLHQQAPGTAPRLLHTGTMAGLPYLVMSQLTGKALLHAWDELSRDAAGPWRATVQAARKVGGLIIAVPPAVGAYFLTLWAVKRYRHRRAQVLRQGVHLIPPDRSAASA